MQITAAKKTGFLTEADEEDIDNWSCFIIHIVVFVSSKVLFWPQIDFLANIVEFLKSLCWLKYVMPRNSSLLTLFSGFDKRTSGNRFYFFTGCI